MTTEQIKRRLSAKPFRPFTIRTADGVRAHVPHPEFLMLSPSGRTIVIASGEDEFEIIDLLLVTSLEVGKDAKRRNGKHR
jgi:hypothetical protein